MNKDFCRMVADALTEQDAKEERRSLRPWVGAVLAGMCLALLFVFAREAYGATYSLRAGNGDSITLTEAPCTQGPWFKDWRAARFVYQGKSYESCWRTVQDTVLVFDSGGDVSAIPMQAFKLDQGV
jgi:hypothetical protein